jgi:hypothetical protein
MWATGITAAVGVGTQVYNHNNQPSASVAPTLTAPTTPGAVSGTYGGAYVDPVTGRVTYASNTTAPNLQTYQDQNTYNQLMGYGGGGTDLANQIASQQKTLDALKAQGAGSAKLSDYLGPEWIGSDGKVIDYTQYINKEGSANPLWASFMASTGGQYGSKNPDISFGKWAKDTYSRDVQPALTNYQNAQKTITGNTSVYNQQVQSAQDQLDSLKNIQTQVYGANGTGTGTSQTNPMLSYLQNGPNQANYISQQVTDQYKNAQNLTNAQNASRGMGSSSMSELAQGQNNNQLAQGILGAQVTGGQNNFNNTTAMLNLLSGNKNAANATQATNTGLYNQQMGLGQGVGQNMSNQTTQQQAAQTGLNMNANQANTNSQLAQNASTTNALTGLAGTAGNAVASSNNNTAMLNWLNNQNSMKSGGSSYTNQYGGYGDQNNMTTQMGGSSYTPYPTTGSINYE